MSGNLAVPAIPPLSAVQDPAARAVLQALVNGWQVRNGQLGAGDKAFITAADVPTVINQYFTSSTNVAGGSPGGGGPIAPIIDRLITDIISSREWASLSERIQRIETPDWLRDALRIAQSDMARQVNALVARLNEATAGIGEERLARATLERAMAQYFRQVIASYGGNLASTTDLYTAIATTASAEASKIGQITADVGQSQLRAEQALEAVQTIDGYARASWTVKLDLNGYVAGVTLGLEGQGGNVSSTFLVRADKFAVGSPTAPGVQPVVPFIVRTIPFTVDGVQYPAGVYMQNVYMQTATLAGDLKSNNYVPNTSGWILRRQARNDGAGTYIAEFYGDVLIGGTLKANTVTTNAIQDDAVSSMAADAATSITGFGSLTKSLSVASGQKAFVLETIAMYDPGNPGTWDPAMNFAKSRVVTGPATATATITNPYGITIQGTASVFIILMKK